MIHNPLQQSLQYAKENKEIKKFCLQLKNILVFGKEFWNVISNYINRNRDSTILKDAEDKKTLKAELNSLLHRNVALQLKADI